MSIADEIRKAMAELNLNTDDVPTTDPELEKEKEPEQEYTLPKYDQPVKLTPAERLIMEQQQELDNPQPELESEPEPEPVTEPMKKPKAPKPTKSKKEKPQPVINMSPKVGENKPSEHLEPVQERPQPEKKLIQETHQKSPTIYMKVAGDKLVVMIPDGVKLEHHNINGENVRAAVVSLPDLSDNELQVLNVINKVEHEPAKPVITQQPEAYYTTQEPTHKAGYEFDVRTVADPNWTPDQVTPIQTKPEPVKFEIEKPKFEKPKFEKRKPVVIPDADLNLDDLLEEKKTLTAEIKEAREAGDTERVNMLRRQRRVVRAKIHQCGG